MTTILTTIGGAVVALIVFVVVVGIVAESMAASRRRRADCLPLEAQRTESRLWTARPVATSDPAVAGLLDACGVSRVLVLDLPSEDA